MFYVYVLQSINYPKEKYIGFTEDLRQRLKIHNLKKSTHTSKFVPWEVISYHAFKEKNKALDFEKYLKTGSGKAFLSKRVL